jgi:hypothetical protein
MEALYPQDALFSFVGEVTMSNQKANHTGNINPNTYSNNHKVVIGGVVKTAVGSKSTGFTVGGKKVSG